MSSTTIKKLEAALRESEDRFRRVAVSSHTMVYEYSVSDGEMVIAAGFEELLGYPTGEIKITLDWWQNQIHPNDRPSIKTRFHFILAESQNFSLQYRIRHKQGHFRFVEEAGEIIRDKSGRALKIIGSVSDITERRLMDEEIWRRQESLRVLSEHSPDIIAKLDIEGRHLYINPSGANLYKLSQEQILGKTFKELNLPESWIRQFENNLHKVLKNGHNEECIFSLEDQDGSRAFHVRYTPDQASNGALNGFLVVMHDITEHKKVHDELEIKVRERTAELEQLNEKLRRIFDSTSDGIVVTDPDGIITQVNNRVAEGLGVREIDLIGKSVLDLVPTAKKDRESEDWKRLQIEGSLHDLEYEYSITKALKVVIEVNSRVLKDAHGGITGYVVAVKDITEKKQILDEREQFTKRLMDVQEEERKRISRDLHDETAQKLALITLELDALVQREKGLSSEISATLERIKKLTNDTLQEVRRFSHELRPSLLEHFGLPEALEQIIDEINMISPIQFKISVAGTERRLPEDIEIALFRIAQEALNNIRKHSAATKAYVNIEYMPRKIRLIVADNGKGFNPGKSRNSPQNKSLGLAGMRERAQLIGADLSINSSGGQGSIIAVEVKSNPKRRK